MNAFWRGAASIIALAMLSACGGQGGNAGPVGQNPGGGGGGGGGGDGGNGSDFEPGVFLPAATFVNRCADPRSGTDPFTGEQYPDLQGATTDENNFLRSWTNETYLWYDEVQDIDPASYDDPREYFDLLKTSEETTSGAPKDKFHFWYDTTEWNQLSESGIVAGYGAQWYFLSVRPPREVVIAHVEPGSPAEAAGLVRGDRVLQIDGVDVANGEDVDTLNNGLNPAEEGEQHSFVIRKRQSGDEIEIAMISDQIVTSPVPNAGTVAAGVGYILFNDHIATAEGALIDAFTDLAAQNVSDLILDLRYNGGGFLGIASEVAYMIAGSQSTGQVFERITFNDKHPSTDPITGEALEPIPFFDSALGFDPTVTAGQALPTLNLSRVYVITSDSTCSASESIINSLRGIDVEVYLIGSTTCGKPYGFYAQDNCGTTYFTIQFQGNNAKGFGDYSDGFSPENEPGGPTGVAIDGCQVADDFEFDLGHPSEARIAAALSFRASGNLSCPTPTSLGSDRQFKPGQSRSSVGPRMYKSPFHQNRFLDKL
jgi:C-terminal processing protease CtpA/Prc